MFPELGVKIRGACRGRVAAQESHRAAPGAVRDAAKRCPVSQSEGPMRDVLAGVRVLDFGRYIAGPYCAALLAELGADVIRIERRGGGAARWGARGGGGGAGAAEDVVKRNQRGMARGPACPEGR